MQKNVLWGIGVVLLLPVLLPGLASALTVEEVVNNFKTKYEKMNNLNADFEETTFIAGRKRVAGGKLNFQKPNLLKQRYLDPSNLEDVTQLIVSDGQLIWSYTPVINQVIKTKLAQDESRMELLPGFGRTLENVDKNYSLALVEDELAGKRGISVLELEPKKASDGTDRMFDVLQVWIRDEDSVPVQFMYKHEKNQMTFILSFKNVKINQDLDESTFKFEVPKGVQIITVPDR